MSRVMITGGAGFIGFHLAKRLIDYGYEVDLVDSFMRGVGDRELERILSCKGVRLLTHDLLDIDALQNMSTNYKLIFHLAAIIGVKNVANKPYKVLSENMIMLLNMIKFAREQQGLERFVFASTSEVYAGTLQYFDLPIPTPEETPLAVTELSQPRTSYMLSKIYGEALCQYSEIPFTIIRPHNIYGPRMGTAHVIPELLKRAHDLADGQKMEVFSVSHKRTFCFITDAVEMIRLAAESPACKGETMNIGSGEPEVTMGEVADYVLNVTGKRVEIIPLGDTPGSPVRRCPDMSKTFSLTGYRSQVDLLQGINLTYEWYKKNIFDGDDISAQ